MQQEVTKPAKPLVKLFLFSFLGLVLAGGLVFAGYEIGKEQGRPPPSISPSPAPVSFQCTLDSDCVLALRLDQCCSCPEVTSRQALLGNQNLIEFKFGEDYSSRKTIDCSNIVCEPCVPPHGSPFCLKGQCQVGEKASSAGEEKVFCQEPRPEVCTMECIAQPPYICGSNGRSYCNKCQACANPAVSWYIVQDNPCVNK